VEVCPLSNMVLGYTFDLRSHPIRDLTYKGLQFSISSDDPGFFDYEGVTLDYAYCTVAWELNLRDLKKLSMNGITYSSIPKDKRDNLMKNVFPGKWAEFIEYLNALEVPKSPFEGKFSDPNHMEGYRNITVVGGVCTIVGCDGPGKPEWTLV